MADLSHQTDGPSPLSEEGYDESLLPDYNREFISEEDLEAFSNALSAPDPSPSTEDLRSPSPNGLRSPSRWILDTTRRQLGREPSQNSLFITAQNDWAPVTPIRKKKEKKKKRKRRQNRTQDETREGYLYTLLKWPLLGVVGAWVLGLGASYILTRLYIWLYGMRS